MKKLIYTFFATAALVFAAGCEREASPVDSDAYVDAEFNVTFAQPLTKAAISDGTTATQLVVGVYDKDGNAYVPTLSWPVSAEHANAFSGLQAKFTARLVKGHGYDIVFLAQAPDNGAYTIDLAAKTLTAKTSGVSNDEARDAFYGTYSVDKVDGAISENVILKRPFAQINVIDLKEDYEAAAAALVNFGGSSLKVTAPTVLNLLDGTVGTPAEYNFSKGTMSMVHPDFDPYKTNGDYWLLDNYILAGTASSTVNLEFSLYDSALLTTYSVPNAPVQRNYRTNIYGSLLTSNGEFVVIIDPIYEGTNEFPIDGKTPTITMQDTTLPASGSTLNAEVSGTINLKAVHPIATIVPTYASSNTSVGTISADGLFTAVAPGTTVVTIKFPAVVNGVAVKGADNTYSSYTITYTVVVKGADLADPELAVSGAPAAAVAAGESFNLTVATKSDGEVTVAAVPAEAVTIADPVSGVYKVTAAELAADTEVTLTVSQAATKVYNAGAKEVKFTVKGKGTPSTSLAGTYVLAVKVDDSYIAMRGVANGTRVSSKAIEYSGTGDLSEVSADLVWTIAEVEGGYSIKGYSGYVGWTSGNTADLKEEACALSITAGEAGVYNIASVADATRKLQYNKASNAQYFAFYTSEQVADFYLIKATASSAPVVTDATITVAKTLTVEVGKTAQIDATTNSTATITYASDAATVATVSASGLVTGVAEGTANVTVAVPAVEGAFSAASEVVAVTVVASSGDWTFDFTSNVKYESGSNSQDASVNANNTTTPASGIKFSTSSANGDGIIYVTKGSTKLEFYAAAWNGVNDATLTFSQDGAEIGSVTPVANSGVSQNPPFTVTVAKSDYYTINLKSDSPVTVTANKRSVLFAAKSNGTGAINIPDSGVKYKKATSIVSGKSYAIVGIKAGKYYAAGVVSGNYGYPSGKECNLDGEFINTDLSAQEFTFTAVEGGYSIKQPGGKYWSTAGTYKSVQLSDTPTVWTVEAQADGTFKITSTVNNYVLQHGNGTYTTFGVSDASDYGTLPFLYEKVD